MKQDLNLFRVFDVLMEVRSVSRAAERLRLTQSAVSHALGRLREQLGDPLFVRTRGGLRPTPRASQMAPTIRDGLSMLRDAFSQTQFEPATTTRVFTISASSYFSATMLPIAIRPARAAAPLAQFRLVAPNRDLLAGLDEGTIDLALGGFGSSPPRFAKSRLFTESLVWVGRAGSARDDIATRPRLALARAPQPSLLDDVAMRGALGEQIAIAPGDTFPQGPAPVIIHDPLSAGAFLASSDLVTQLPKQLALMISGRTNVEILAPSDRADIEMSMLWHARSTPEPAHVWLRGLITAAAATLG